MFTKNIIKVTLNDQNVQNDYKNKIKMCLCDRESPVGNPLHNSKFKFRACPYRPRSSSLAYFYTGFTIDQ